MFLSAQAFEASNQAWCLLESTFLGIGLFEGMASDYFNCLDASLVPS